MRARAVLTEDLDMSGLDRGVGDTSKDEVED
jgi:hypothetical protein